MTSTEDEAVATEHSPVYQKVIPLATVAQVASEVRDDN